MRYRARWALAGLFSLAAASAASAAIIVPTASGGWATMTAITSVDTAKIVGNLRWSDPLGNIKTATGVAVRPQVSAAASLARGLLARRLVLGAVVAAALYETLSTKLAPGTQISPDGTPQVVVSGTPVVACTMTYIKALGTTTPLVSSFGYLPCAYSSTAPTRLIIRVPLNSAWQPSAEWLNQYGTSSKTTRQLPFVLQGGDHADTTSGFYEYTRPQPTTAVDVPTSSVTSMGEAEQARLLMDPNVIGPLAQADAIPPDFFQAVDTATDTDPGSTSDDGSELPDGPDIGDVDRSSFDLRAWFNPAGWGFLPQQCHWPAIDVPGFPEWRVDLGEHDAWSCPLLSQYVATAMDIVAVLLFLGIVIRTRMGG